MHPSLPPSLRQSTLPLLSSSLRPPSQPSVHLARADRLPRTGHCGAGRPHGTSTVTLPYFIDVETGPDFPDEDTEAWTGHDACPRSPGSEWQKRDLVLQLRRLPGLQPQHHGLQRLPSVPCARRCPLPTAAGPHLSQAVTGTPANWN